MRPLLVSLTMVALCTFDAFGFLGGGDDSNLPVSKQASLVENYSSSEVTIQASGMGRKDKDAIVDVRKAAVYFVLFQGTDPLLNSDGAQTKFEAIQEELFDPQNIMKYISWEANKVVSTVRTRLPDGKKGYKITKMVRVNKKALTDELVAKGIITSRKELAEEIGLPFVMVIPEAPKGSPPLGILESDKGAKHAAATIESFLTARKYDVVVPSASEQLNDMGALQAELKGSEEDISYQLALALGSDVYITFNQQVQGGKATASIRAYETSTARLLGTETGYSENRPGTTPNALIEEAINDAIDKVLSRIRSYWEEDAKRGMQYKIVFKFVDDFGMDQREEIQWAISDLFDESFAYSKENVVTDKTLDYLAWATPDDFKRASKIYRFFKSEMAGEATIRRMVLNRKLLILGIHAPSF